MRWQAIRTELDRVDRMRRDLTLELSAIQAACRHPNLPKRAPNEEHMDTCPDCGQVSYCYGV